MSDKNYSHNEDDMDEEEKEKEEFFSQENRDDENMYRSEREEHGTYKWDGL